MAWETQRIAHYVGDVFGYYALQLGLPALDALAANRMPLKLFADLQPPAQADCAQSALASLRRAWVVAAPEELPFASQSIDLLVVPHALEFSARPHQVLREIERVLMPEGRVVITGFNPWSLWGARQRLFRRWRAPFLPREGNFINLPRLKDWMKLLSLEIEQGHFGCYAPACRSERWLQRWGFLEAAGDRWWPVGGSVYSLMAIKRVVGMRLVGPARRRPAKAALGVPVPTVGRV